MPNQVTATIKVNSSQALAQFKGLEGAMTRASVVGNLMATGITSGLSVIAGAAGKAGGALAGAFSKANALQVEMASTAGDFAKLTGLSYQEATKEIDNFNDRMDKLAAKLPGQTEDYKTLGRSITDNLVGAFKTADGELDKIGFNSALDSLTESATLRANFSGVATAQAGRGLSKLIGGNSSIKELKQLEFFEKNPAVVAFIESEAKKSGKTLKEMGQRELVKLAEISLGVSDEVLNAAKNSVSGVMEGFKDSLFSPTQGVFGIMRDLDKSVEGDQSVYSNFTRVIKKIFGDNGLFSKVSEVLSSLGISGDPMKVLANGIGKFGMFIDRVSKFLGKFSKFNPPKINISDLGSKYGKWVSGLYNKLLDRLNNLDWNKIGVVVGQAIAGGINSMSNFLRNLDLGSIGVLLLNILRGVTVALGSAFVSIDWGSLAITLMKLAAVAIAALGGFIASAFAGMGTLAVAAITTMGLAITTLFFKASSFLSTQTGKVTAAISDFASGVSNWIRKQISRLPGLGRLAPKSDGGNVENKADGQNVTGFLNALNAESRQAPGTTPVIANSSEVILNRSQQALALGGNRGGGSIMNVQSLIVNANTNNPEKLADDILTQLNKKFQQYSNTQIVGSF